MAAFDKKQMDAVVNRFLGWKLPQTFGPDCFVSFDREKAKANQSWPIGTNLLTADEARAMLEHVLDATFIPDWSLLEATQASLREHMALVSELRRQLAAAQAVADHLFIDARGDGPWLVCVEKVFDTEDQARTACRKWQAATGGVPACAPTEPKGGA